MYLWVQDQGKAGEDLVLQKQGYEKKEGKR